MTDAGRLGSAAFVAAAAILLAAASPCLSGTISHLHVLLIGDTDDGSVGKSVQADLNNLKRTLEYGIPPFRRTITVLSGAEATPKSVLRQVQDLTIQDKCSLFVYYSGHGVIDPELGHVFTMTHGRLSRKELLAAMRAKKARLRILVTDCCAVYAPVSVRRAERLREDWSIFRSLFFLHDGEVDVLSLIHI